MHAVEDGLGRVRTVRNGPRTIDIDLVDFGGIRLDTPDLTLPHPRARLRSFVMEPLRELGIDVSCCDAKVDALVFDAFSNPDAKMIEARLFPFIEKLRAAHPEIPLIFQQTIYRERRNFDQGHEKHEADKLEMAEKLMKEACKKYNNVYYIQTTNATSDDNNSTVDGVHPDNYGYTLWAKSIEKPILKILKKHGVK